MGHRLGDRHQLALADAEIADRLAHVDGDIGVGQHGAGLALHAPAVEAAEPSQDSLGDLVAEEEIGGDVEAGDEVKLLEDGGDAGRLGLARIGVAHVHSRDADGAVVRLDHAGKDVHQRGLAGAVLAQERVHLAGLEIEIDAAQGVHAAEALLDAVHLQEEPAHEWTSPWRSGGQPQDSRSFSSDFNRMV